MEKAIESLGSNSLSEGESLHGILESFAPSQPRWDLEAPLQRKEMPLRLKFVLLSGAALLAFGMLRYVRSRKSVKP